MSVADRETELLLRDRLHAARPDHRVLGEEDGETGPAGSPWRWLLDPIDGTKNYVRGIPVFATLVSLQHGDETVLGAVSAPALGRRWWAARGDGAFAAGEQRHVSAVAELGDALLSYDDVTAFDRADSFLALARRCRRVRGYSDFWGHMLVAEGAADAAVQAEPDAKLWDLAPLQVIVEEAGGRFTDLAGRPGPHGGTAVSSNALLHDTVLAALR